MINCFLFNIDKSTQPSTHMSQSSVKIRHKSRSHRLTQLQMSKNSFSVNQSGISNLPSTNTSVNISGLGMSFGCDFNFVIEILCEIVMNPTLAHLKTQREIYKNALKSTMHDLSELVADINAE